MDILHRRYLLHEKLNYTTILRLKLSSKFNKNRTVLSEYPAQHYSVTDDERKSGQISILREREWKK